MTMAFIKNKLAAGHKEFVFECFLSAPPIAI
jgi:hypothetical protein